MQLFLEKKQKEKAGYPTFRAQKILFVERVFDRTDQFVDVVFVAGCFVFIFCADHADVSQQRLNEGDERVEQLYDLIKIHVSFLLCRFKTIVLCNYSTINNRKIQLFLEKKQKEKAGFPTFRAQKILFFFLLESVGDRSEKTFDVGVVLISVIQADVLEKIYEELEKCLKNARKLIHDSTSLLDLRKTSCAYTIIYCFKLQVFCQKKFKNCSNIL